MSDVLTLEHQAGPVLVTVGYLVLYYASMNRVVRVKRRLAREHAARGEVFDRYLGGDREMLAADRAQLNTLEHMPPFLVLLWLHAIFVGPSGATIGGGIYLGSRLLHPWLIGGRLGPRLGSRVYLATMPGYLVLLYLAGALLVGVAGA